MLKDVKVLDLSRVLSGPFCSRMLADMGAEVVKVESKSGDGTRTGMAFKGEFSCYFTQFNVGKRCISVNLHSEAGVDLVKKLAAECDVILENFRPGTMAEMGLGYETLKEINPNIIYCSISGFGQSGEYANRPAYADIVHALSGLEYAGASMDGADGNPPGMPISYADTNTSLNAAIAILAALYNRKNTGEGQYIDIAMIDCLLASNDSTIQKYVFSDGLNDAPPPAAQPPLKMKDGHLAASLVLTFPRVAEAIGRPDLLEDERFNPPINLYNNYRDYREIVYSWAAKTTVEQACEIFEKYEIPFGKVQTTADVVNSTVVRERNMLVDVELPGVGDVKVVNTPFRFSGVETGPQRPPSRKGGDNKEVLQDWLGLTSEQVDELKKTDTIF
ncbi:CoA transferase [Pseudomaricurvus alkylphenolicus]|uniref:CaiB/BaiF CoA transferase family protein n=1 Tax=Pseudomaricurvus alkylphenolicus TaxID=1306991 RepID=UPI00142149A2|nr:CaiB/BaiF CoA-transferase family protein [Pseudomaricurvus alkylphenolicus]NIB45032.1 CoA transferase [Pseudomaricurvus alkylphenolicus]